MDAIHHLRRGDQGGSNLGVDQRNTYRKSRKSVLKSTRNLLARIGKTKSTRHFGDSDEVVRTSSGRLTRKPLDPIERFLRSVDNSQGNSEVVDGYQVDSHDVIRCTKKGSTLVFLPSATGRVVWDCWVGLMIVYYLMVVPLRLSFVVVNENDQFLNGTGGWLAIDFLCDVLFCVDIFVNFRTAFFRDGELEVRPRKMAWEYLKGWFIIDAVASFPTSILILAAGDTDTTNYNYIARTLRPLKLTKLFRVLRVTRIASRLEQYTMFLNAGFFRLMRSLVLFVVMWHIIGCVYFGVAFAEGFCRWVPDGDDNVTIPHFYEWGGNYQSPNGFQECYDDWVPWEGLTQQPFTTQYFQAFYWAVMVTTGIGKDINPQSLSETIFTIVVIFAGVIMYAVIIGSLSSALQAMDHKNHQHNQQMERITTFMRYNKVPGYLQRAIKQFYEYKWSRPAVDGGHVVADLPSVLKIRLKVFLNREALGHVPVFRELPPECMIALIQHVKQVTIFPNEHTTHQGEMNHHFYIIRHGRMQLTRKPSMIFGAKHKWKALLARWSQSRKKSIDSIASVATTAYRDHYLLSMSSADEEVVRTLSRGDFYGENSLIDLPEDFSCRAIVFSELLTLDTSHRALKIIMEEYPVMEQKIHEFADQMRKKIISQYKQKEGIQRSKSLFGGMNRSNKSRSPYSVQQNGSSRSVARKDSNKSIPEEQEMAFESLDGAEEEALPLNQSGAERKVSSASLPSSTNAATSMSDEIAALKKEMARLQLRQDAHHTVLMEKLEEICGWLGE